MDIDFSKNKDGLVPVVVQDAQTRFVLMLGYMNAEAYQKTIDTQKVTFFSRTKQRLWTKGEESGNVLHLVEISVDCDKDSLLAKVNPAGPTCHTGTDTCWGEKNGGPAGFLKELEQIIADRKLDKQNPNSYIASLFKAGINKVAQKVGEEAVEVVIEAKDDNRDLFLNESADLLFHYLILLQAKDSSISEILQVLESRHKQH
jgi:phosphoribosyl-AMP cyclohydrolase / phosphoribosyl-ATP pyrophosphohydrolase